MPAEPTCETSFVTGATGFVGSALCTYLKAKGERVIGSSRRPPMPTPSQPWDNYCQLELGDTLITPSLFEGVDTIYHLAATVHIQSPTEQTRLDYYRINARGTEQLLRAASAAGVKRFVFLSSVAVLGEDSNQCLDESAPINCLTPYAQSKYEAECLVLTQEAPPHRSVLRPPLVYGPNCPGNLRRMIRMVDKGRFPPMPTLSNRRSMIHVQDLAGALYLTAHTPKANGEIFHVSDGIDYSTSDIYQWILKSLNKHPPTWYIPISVLHALAKAGNLIEVASGRDFIFSDKTLQKLIGNACYNTNKIQNMLGFTPTHSLENSMEAIVKSFS